MNPIEEQLKELNINLKLIFYSIGVLAGAIIGLGLGGAFS